MTRSVDSKINKQLSFERPSLEESWIAVDERRTSPYEVTPLDSPLTALSSDEDDDQSEPYETEDDMQSAAEIDLATSLSRLISRVKERSDESDDDPTEIAYRHSTRKSRVRLSTVRIISDQEMDKYRISDTDRLHKRVKKRPERDPTDQGTVSYVASLSFVAGISFSAGYFVGRRSGMLRAAN